MDTTSKKLLPPELPIHGPGPKEPKFISDIVSLSRAHPEEYHAWANMWARCTRSNHPNYPQYRSRRPPESWRSFEVFFAEVGSRPSPKHSLDRIKNHLPYGPGNVRWVTIQEQSNNKAGTIYLSDGKIVKPLMDWARSLKVSRQSLRNNPHSRGLARVSPLHSPHDQSAHRRTQTTGPETF